MIPAGLRIPSRRAGLDFLARAATLADGRVLSWVSADHPGYVYPEAGGFVVGLLARQGDEGLERAGRIAAWLTGCVEQRGAVGRDGLDYAFDSSVVAAGLLAYRDASGATTCDDAIAGLEAFITGCIGRGRALGGASRTVRPRWSTRFGCHHLKLAATLAACGHNPTSTPVARLGDTLLPLYDRGRFRVNAQSDETYAHACCYAVEGCMTLAAAGGAEAACRIEGCAEWLAGIQTGDGGIPAGHDGKTAIGEPRADATAQSVRIWLWTDRERFRVPIERGLAFLAGLQDSAGGIRYAAASADANTWATVFTVQALDWLRNGPASSSLL